MKVLFFRVIGKFLLMVSSLLWKLRYEWSFILHQKIGWFLIKLNHKHKLNLWGDDDKVNTF